MDVGSTTAKVVVLNERQEMVFHRYVRHHALIDEAVSGLCREISASIGSVPARMAVTGSAAMGVAERSGLSFIQELVASSEFVVRHCPEVRTLIDMGGEDTKMIFFSDTRLPDIRMNGNCAGGTGAFIDQMAMLFDVTPAAFDALAAEHGQLYPIASRCGVFAKTDVQNLLSRKVSRADIAYSVYYAVAMQSINTLSRGCEIMPKILFSGGPFSFLQTLSEAFLSVLGLHRSDCVQIEHPELVPAWGAALYASVHGGEVSPEALSDRLQASSSARTLGSRMEPIFASGTAYRAWKEERKPLEFNRVMLSEYTGKQAFLGIDAGSTTTKIVLTGTQDELLFHFYAPNNGQIIETVQQGLRQLHALLADASHPVQIVAEAVTGYGEDLVRSAFGLSFGLVETLAHYIASCRFDPDVSFILDIGGQDMKAFFVRDRQVRRIELNESCSSGCGSFIETFSRSLGCDVASFAEMACRATAPCDLGSRCTVFMNSRVKQALRENAAVEDIAAGLSYSVVRNALYKVLNMRDLNEIGNHVMVQGGTFRNQSVRRAFEILTGRLTEMTDLPEMMGAYGAALYARQCAEADETLRQPFSWDTVEEASRYDTFFRQCQGCENRCAVSELRFRNGRKFYSGNKCENVFHNYAAAVQPGENLSAWKLQQLFADGDAMPSAEPACCTVGIPRALHFYEKYPFWRTLLGAAGIRTELSAPSTVEVYRKGKGTIMSDNICFPAKLLHGHVADLTERRIDRILYPVAVYEAGEYSDASDTFNCPIVSGYSDVIGSTFNLDGQGIPLDTPRVNFGDVRLLGASCKAYLETLGVPAAVAAEAFRKALAAQTAFKLQLRVRGAALIARAAERHEPLIVLAGRPYHTDSLINSKVPDIISQFGAHVITEDMVPLDAGAVKDLQVLPQWSYTNRIYAAAAWVAAAADTVQMVQINSFGCGPDAIAIDEVRSILRAGGKYLTVVRVDEINATGSLRLRLRSMLESMRYRQQRPVPRQKQPRRGHVPFFPEDKERRTILAPDFGPFYSLLIRPIFTLSGYRYETLPEPDYAAIQEGLRYANNEVCYPATLVIGSLISALKSGRYDLDRVAVGVTQTCGQCRASSYLSLLKKALHIAGFDNVPAITIGTAGRTINEQPGLRINYLGMIRCIVAAMIAADMLMKMCHAVQARERQRGGAMELAMRYVRQVEACFARRDVSGIWRLLEQAVSDFSAVETHGRTLTKVGLVGEIYVKYNPAANGHIVEWLNAHDAEVVVPPLIDFFVQSFIDRKVNEKAFLRRRSAVGSLFTGVLWSYVDRCLARANKLLSRVPFCEPFEDIRALARRAEPLIHLENQAGEGWLIAAEVAHFAETGVTRVISVQPFGCIANQVVSKGIEKRLRNRYPALNLLFLDFDSNVSEVNVQNRLHFILQ